MSQNFKLTFWCVARDLIMPKLKYCVPKTAIFSIFENRSDFDSVF